jgi:hypothetical protein
VDLSEFSRVLVYGSGLAALQAVADLDALGLGGGALQMVMPASEHGSGEAADEAYDALATMAAAMGMRLPEPEVVAGGWLGDQLRPLQRSAPCPALPCPALPCPALPCPALPCPALPCPALPCPCECVVTGKGCLPSAAYSPQLSS